MPNIEMRKEVGHSYITLHVSDHFLKKVTRKEYSSEFLGHKEWATIELAFVDGAQVTFSFEPDAEAQFVEVLGRYVDEYRARAIGAEPVSRAPLFDIEKVAS